MSQNWGWLGFEGEAEGSLVELPIFIMCSLGDYVVYFDQHLVALHSKPWLKSPLPMFFYVHERFWYICQNMWQKSIILGYSQRLVGASGYILSWPAFSCFLPWLSLFLSRILRSSSLKALNVHINNNWRGLCCLGYIIV